jgi:hypothetical protein
LRINFPNKFVTSSGFPQYIVNLLNSTFPEAWKATYKLRKIIRKIKYFLNELSLTLSQAAYLEALNPWHVGRLA